MRQTRVHDIYAQMLRIAVAVSMLRKEEIKKRALGLRYYSQYNQWGKELTKRRTTELVELV